MLRNAHRIAASTAVALLALGACGPDSPDHGQFNISIGYSVDYHGCPSATCGFYTTACGAKMSVRLVDAETGEILTSDCVDLEGVDLCMINEAEVELDAVRPGMSRIEVALWNPDDLIDGRCPTDEIFDNQPLGAPKIDYQPQPALGGATYFDVGTEANVQVQMACGDYAHLDEATCKLVVNARVDDLTTGLFVPRKLASNFDVAAGEPVLESEGGDVRWLLGPSELTELRQTDPDLALPRWSGELQQPFDDHACISVFDTSVFQAVASVACVPVVDEISVVELRGLFLAKDTLDKLLQAAVLGSFPEPGLVIGRVVDHLGQGVAMVEVTPTGGGVEYLSEDGTTFLNTSATASDGIFISRDAPFGATWTALHTDDGRVEDGIYEAGLIEGKASVMIIQLQAP